MGTTTIKLAQCEHGGVAIAGADAGTAIMASIRFKCGCEFRGQGTFPAVQPTPAKPSKFARKVRTMDFAPKP